ILARIDADAILPPDWAKRIADYFGRPEALQTAWTGGALFYNVRFARLTSRMYGWIGFSLNKFYAGHASLWGSSMAFPAALWRVVEPGMCVRGDVHEDLDLSMHLHE